MLGASWKTTSAGILAIVGAIVSVWWSIQNGSITPEILMTAAAGIITGIGLLFARDNNVTSEQANAGKANAGGGTEDKQQ